MIVFPVYRGAHEPTDAQIKSGNYKKRQIDWNGLVISIENEAGSIRRGTNSYGKPWETRMLYPYGYIRSTMGVDGDHVDCFLGPNMDAPIVYVIHQRKHGAWSQYDEDKCMIGFDSEDEAKSAFLACYDDPRFLGPITVMSVDEFREKVLATKDKPQMVKAIFFKALVAAHTRRLPSGKVVQVRAYSNRRTKKSSPQTEKLAIFARRKSTKKVTQSDGPPDESSHNRIISGHGDDRVELFHGTDSSGAKAIAESGYIRRSAFFTPDRTVAQAYGGPDGEVITVSIPKSDLMIDMDLPGQTLLTVDEANGYAENDGWTIEDYIRNGHSVGVESDVYLREPEAPAKATPEQVKYALGDDHSDRVDRFLRNFDMGGNDELRAIVTEATSNLPDWSPDTHHQWADAINSHPEYAKITSDRQADSLRKSGRKGAANLLSALASIGMKVKVEKSQSLGSSSTYLYVMNPENEKSIKIRLSDHQPTDSSIDTFGSNDISTTHQHWKSALERAKKLLS